MKHRMRKSKKRSWAAYCTRPGCMAGIEGVGVEEMSQQDLNSLFKDGECPAVFNPDNRSMSHNESIKYLLSRAKKEIKSWEKLIKYWENK